MYRRLAVLTDPLYDCARRKAVRAALFLLPLLGITHSLEMFEPPLDRSVAVFGCYTIVLAVLDSFQGFYISLLYCFINQEVTTAP